MKIKVRVLFSVFMAFACLSKGQAETVSTVDELVTALWDHRGETSTTIVLAKGSYNVSGMAMPVWNAKDQKEQPTAAHISISRVTLRGETDNPRDTVIYCNGTNNVLYCYQGAVNSLTISNGCTGATASGGGVSALNTATVLSNCVITCCHSAAYGGGVHNAKCIDCDICFNTSAQSGAGAYRAHLIGCRIFGNESDKDGGGAHQTIVVGGCRVYGNAAKGGGGGVSNSYSGKAWTYDSTIVSNTASTGGGAYNMVLTNCTVAFNTAKNGGGVAYKSEISDSWVTNNVATSASGGGGGVYSSAESEVVTVMRCEIAGNFTAGKGGGTYLATVEDSFIHDNFAGSEDGGAASYKGSIVGGVVSNNVSGASGSGLCSVTSVRNCRLFATPIDSVGELVNCRVCGYTNGWVLAEGANAVTNGHFAGQDTLTAGTFAARNTLFADNRVTTVFDGNGTSGIAFESCTVAGNRFSNTFQNFGNAAKGPCRLANTIFAGNKSLSGATDYGATWGKSQKLAFTNCLFASSTSSTSNLAFPPVDCLFAAQPRFDEKNAEEPYSLKRTSPARGAGLVMDWMADATDVRNDLRYPRLRDGAVDIGCYQCWLDPTGVMLIFR